jgi:hypothetical protein
MLSGGRLALDLAAPQRLAAAAARKTTTDR